MNFIKSELQSKFMAKQRRAYFKSDKKIWLESETIPEVYDKAL